ncbi:hypothetical protein AMJ48_02440 [Parcubacteria bacterium DG_74_1]|nr:MAG: hypothetical protein AMJ48_02440 [Parcubacteria bacterium DG_74_1]
MPKNQQYDVVIIGAGPAGCITTYYLSKKYKTLLLDRSDFPRDKPCGGLLIEESQDFLKGLRIPSYVFSHPKYLGVKYIDWNNNMEVGQKRKIGNISRKKFDYWLLKLCRKNINFSPKTTFLKYRRGRDGLEIFIKKNGKESIINTKYLVFATGSSLPIRKIFTNKKINYYLVIQWWLKVNKKVKDFILIYDNKITDSYSYLIPKGDYLIVGTGLIPGNTEAKMKDFVEKLKKKLNILGKIIKKEAAIVLNPRSVRNIVLGNNNVILVGEAAGFISTNASEGISYALRSGYSCAKALNKNFKSAPKKYRNLCKPLIKEIKDKIQKFNILANPRRRKNNFLKMGK